jgi:hypothetical protein
MHKIKVMIVSNFSLPGFVFVPVTIYPCPNSLINVTIYPLSAQCTLQPVRSPITLISLAGLPSAMRIVRLNIFLAGLRRVSLTIYVLYDLYLKLDSLVTMTLYPWLDSQCHVLLLT